MECTEDVDVVKSSNQVAIMHAKVLAYLQFNWYLFAILVFTIIFYTRTIDRNYTNKVVAYEPLDYNPKCEGNKMDNTTIEMGS